jgi:chromosome segregation ATPase
MLLAQAILFYGLLALLLLAAVFSGISLIAQNRRSKKLAEGEINDLRSRIKGFDSIVREKENSLQEQLKSVDERSRANETLKANISELEVQLIELKDQLRKEAALKAGFLAGAAKLEEELAKARKESALANQMHEGLKGQYDELEERFSQLFQQFLEEQKRNQPLAKLQTPPADI